MSKQSFGAYRPDIDGLRAIAVALVLLCHAKFAPFAGGFIGVDVFFTISGYVVARSLLRDIADGSFSFSDFYVRRAKRLVPTLFTVLLATFLFSVLFLIPDDAMEVAKNFAYATALASNIYLAKQTGYFDADAAHQPLLHTWSLSVEEQFYLVLPILLVSLRRMGSRGRVTVVGLLACASLIWAEIARAKGLPSSYFFAQYRAFEFLIGILLALIVHRLPCAKVTKSAYLWGGLCALGACAVTMGGAPFPGVWALLPCGATALIIAGGSGAWGVSILSNKPMVWMGQRSYSLYLWHWPVLFASHRLGFSSTLSATVCIGISLILAHLTYLHIESRFRYIPMKKTRAAIAFIAMPMLVAISLVGIGRSTGNFLPLFPEGFRKVYAQATDADWVGGRGGACWDKTEVSAPETCSVGNPHGRKAVLWGDSHAYQFVYFFDQLGKEYNYSIHDLTRPACPPVENPGVANGKQLDVDCRKFNAKVMNYLLRSNDIDTVFVSATWASYYGSDDINSRFKPGEMTTDMKSTFRKLSESGKKIVLLDDVPSIPEKLVNCQLYNRLVFSPEQRDCTFPVELTYGLRDANRSVFGPVISAVPNVKVLHTFGITCAGGSCNVSSEGVPLYRNNDATHLNLTGGIAY
ncbi:acyltransferase family protein [Pandoraea cepalis]|uniref:O-acetyltransferase OatA n=1 Tax=Pandoraea cepalis TaxID=2508294 RepID=A0A5E4VVV2_9BURK|nr:acyltransferase family protein [Pandoraea cepalis]VVE15739.1 O-acetyltransferase OatA [Pandoraea cepalis]